MRSLLITACCVMLTAGFSSNSTAQWINVPVNFYAPLASGYSYNGATTNHNTVPIDVDLYLTNPPFVPNYMQVHLYEYIAPTNSYYDVPATHFAQGIMIPLTSMTVDSSGITHFRYTANLSIYLSAGQDYFFYTTFYNSLTQQYAINPQTNQMIGAPSRYFSLDSYILHSGLSAPVDDSTQPTVDD